jgi:hypothetical protein
MAIAMGVRNKLVEALQVSKVKFTSFSLPSYFCSAHYMPSNAGGLLVMTKGPWNIHRLRRGQNWEVTPVSRFSDWMKIRVNLGTFKTFLLLQRPKNLKNQILWGLGPDI